MPFGIKRDHDRINMITADDLIMLKKQIVNALT